MQVVNLSYLVFQHHLKHHVLPTRFPTKMFPLRMFPTHGSRAWQKLRVFDVQRRKLLPRSQNITDRKKNLHDHFHLSNKIPWPEILSRSSETIQHINKPADQGDDKLINEIKRVLRNTISLLAYELSNTIRRSGPNNPIYGACT